MVEVSEAEDEVDVPVVGVEDEVDGERPGFFLASIHAIAWPSVLVP